MAGASEYQKGESVMTRWKGFRNGVLLFFLAGSAFFAGCAGLGTERHEVAAPPQAGCTQANTAVRDYFSRINSAPPELVKLLTLFPKGGDIHNHLSGTVMPEDYIAMGTAAGDCYDPQGYAITRPPCSVPANPPLSQAGPADRQNLINTLSMNDFGYPDIQSGHDHFFATFGKFGTVSGVSQGPMLAKLLQQADGDSVDYVETMMSFQAQAVTTLSDSLRQRYPLTGPYYTDKRYYQEMYDYLLSQGLAQAVAMARMDLSRSVNQARGLLGCGTPKPDPACAVSFRFLAAVNRNADLAKVFTQTALSFLLAKEDDRVVGVNLVSGEDLPTSMQDFVPQMAIFGYQHTILPQVNIALHAGEITPCFVGAGNPALKDHLTASIAAGAKRLGHGISFAFLDSQGKDEVVGMMRQQNTLVEVPMTSNAQILGIAGNDHPFPQYFRDNRLPTAFATDDEGVSHTNYTVEWIYAALQYGLRYEELVALARFSLQYSFLPGAPLWQDVRAARIVAQCAGVVPGSPNPPESCRSFLQQSEKAGQQWGHEAALARFDQEHGDRLRRYAGSSSSPCVPQGERRPGKDKARNHGWLRAL